MGTNLVVFDFDGTLMKGNSFKILLREISKFSFGTNFSTIYYSILRKLRIINLLHYEEKVLSVFAGWKESEILDWGKRFFERALAPRLFIEGIETFAKYRDRGFDLMIASGAPDFYLNAAADYFGVTRKICSKLEYHNSLFTGKFQNSLLIGQNKSNALYEYCNNKGYNLSEIYGYSDHISDLPFLCIIGHPYVVNPDKNLLVSATQRKWPILYWE